MEIPTNESEESIRYSEWVNYASEQEGLSVTVEVPHRLSVATLKQIDSLATAIVELAEDPENTLSREESDKLDQSGMADYWVDEEGYEGLHD